MYYSERMPSRSGYMQPHLIKRIGNRDMSRYLVSEKYDGVRAIYDGETFSTKTGRVLHIPGQRFNVGDRRVLRGGKLDGELWAGRGAANFDYVNGLIHKHRTTPGDWSRVKYMVFDFIPGNEENYTASVEDRLKLLRKNKAGSWKRKPGVVIAPHFDVASIDLGKYIENLRKAGAEGVVFKKKGSMYFLPHRRFGPVERAWLKLKFTHDVAGRLTGFDGKVGIFTGGGGEAKIKISHLRPRPKLNDRIKIQHFGKTSKGSFRHPSVIDWRRP